MLKTKRIYEEESDDDGYRILVDRLWARGESKKKADLDDWAKDIAPTTKTRKAFDHEAVNYEDFEKEYFEELDENEKAKEFLKLVKDKLKESNVTLLYGAKNEKINNAVVLKKWIEEHL